MLEEMLPSVIRCCIWYASIYDTVPHEVLVICRKLMGLGAKPHKQSELQQICAHNAVLVKLVL
jgi:hypothetical protein